MLVALGLFAAVLFILGLLFAFWIPVIPLIQWWAGIVSWVILTLEVLVAAPLWAFAHAFTEGEGFAGDRAKQGYMLFARLLLMPALMVISMFLAIQIAAPVLQVMGGMLMVFAGSLGQGTLGPIGLIVMLLILFLMTNSTVSRIFGLVTWLPNNLMNWLGQMHHSLGEEGHAKETINMLAGYFQRGGTYGAGGYAMLHKGSKTLTGKAGGAGGGGGSGETKTLPGAKKGGGGTDNDRLAP